MRNAKNIKIFQFYDIYGYTFDACLGQGVEINFREAAQYGIVVPKEDPDTPLQRLYERLSTFNPSFPQPPPRNFYINLDFKRNTRAESGIPERKTVLCITNKRALELSDSSDDLHCYASDNLELLIEQKVVPVGREMGKNEKLPFCLAEILVQHEELMRCCT